MLFCCLCVQICDVWIPLFYFCKGYKVWLVNMVNLPLMFVDSMYTI